MPDEVDPEQHKSDLAGDYDAGAAAYDAHWGPAIAPLAVGFLQNLRLCDAQTILDPGQVAARRCATCCGRTRPSSGLIGLTGC